MEQVVKRRYRLRHKRRFRQVRQTGKSYSHRLLVLCLLPNEEPVSRSGFTASKRIGNAVMRNRARRRMNEAIRLLWDLIEPGWDMVWIARPAINNADYPDLQAACVRLLQRAKVLTTGEDRSETMRSAASQTVGFAPMCRQSSAETTITDRDPRG
jgi:ribonuclease P protein component